MKNILITGGAGYIGCHVVLELLKFDFNIYIVDNFSRSTIDNLKNIENLTNKKIEFSNVDLRDYKSLKKIFFKFSPEIILHLAGFKSVEESTFNPLLYYDNNINSTLNLLRLMDEFRCENLVFSSSATIYGNPHYLPYDEDHPKFPENPYGETKLFIEKILSSWSKCSKNRKVISLRYFNPVGAHKSGLIGEDLSVKTSNLMPSICKVLLGKQKKLNIYGNNYSTEDGTAERDFIHILDLANAHVCALKFCYDSNYIIDKHFEAFNIGYGKSFSVLKLVKLFEEVSKKKININFSEKRSGDLPIFWANSDFAQHKLNWKPTHTYREICEDTWNYLNVKFN